MLATDTNFNIKKWGRNNGLVFCELISGEKLIDERTPPVITEVNLYGWSNEEEGLHVYTMTETPSTDNKALTGANPGDIEAITKVTKTSSTTKITVDSIVFTRDSSLDINLV